MGDGSILKVREQTKPCSKKMEALAEGTRKLSSGNRSGSGEERDDRWQENQGLLKNREWDRGRERSQSALCVLFPGHLGSGRLAVLLLKIVRKK